MEASPSSEDKKPSFMETEEESVLIGVSEKEKAVVSRGTLLQRAASKGLQPWYITSMPMDVMMSLLHYLNYNDLLSMAQTCKYWNKLASDDKLWKHLALSSAHKAELADWEPEEVKVTTRKNNSNDNNIENDSKQEESDEDEGDDGDDVGQRRSGKFTTWKAKLLDVLFNRCALCDASTTNPVHRAYRIKICSPCLKTEKSTRRYYGYNAKFSLTEEELKGANYQVHRRARKCPAANYYKGQTSNGYYTWKVFTEFAVKVRAAQLFGNLKTASDPVKREAIRTARAKKEKPYKDLKEIIKTFGSSIEEADAMMGGADSTTLHDYLEGVEGAKEVAEVAVLVEKKVKEGRKKALLEALTAAGMQNQMDSKECVQFVEKGVGKPFEIVKAYERQAAPKRKRQKVEKFK